MKGPVAISIRGSNVTFHMSCINHHVCLGAPNAIPSNINEVLPITSSVNVFAF